MNGRMVHFKGIRFKTQGTNLIVKVSSMFTGYTFPNALANIMFAIK